MLNNKQNVFFSFLILSLLFIASGPYISFNSDVLYTYSFAKDLLSGISLHGWQTTPSWYFFPDILISYIIVFFAKSPLQWWYIVYVIPILSFIFLFCYLFCKHQKANQLFAFTLSLVIVFSIFMIVFGKGLRYIVEPFFLFGYHGFASILSIVLFLILQKNQFDLKNHIFFYVFTFLIALSDCFFILDFGAFLSAYFLLTRQKLFQSSIILLLSAIAILLNWKFNIGFQEQLHNSNFSSFSLSIFIVQLFFISLMSTLFYIHYKKNKKDVLLASFLLGSVVILLVILLTGLIKDIYGLRYLSVIPLVLVIYLFISIKALSNKNLRLIYILVLFLLCIFIGYSYILKNRTMPQTKYNEEIEYINHCNNVNIVASYWSAKYIFESTLRQNNLIQVSLDLKQRNWIYNTEWAKLPIPSNKYVVITEEIEQPLLEQLIANHGFEQKLNGKILLGECNQCIIQ